MMIIDDMQYNEFKTEVSAVVLACIDKVSQLAVSNGVSEDIMRLALRAVIDEALNPEELLAY